MTKLVIKYGIKLTKNLLLEQLRYAGVINIEGEDITIYPPTKVDVKNWVEQNKGRMASFGIMNVVVEK